MHTRFKKEFNRSSGYIALMSVVVVSLILIGMTAVLSTVNFFARFNVLDSEYKKVSLALAEACAETAMLNLAKNPAYQPSDAVNGDQITIGTGKTCRICSVSGSGPYTITTRSVFGRANTNLTLTITPAFGNFTVSDWSEIATYSGTCLSG